VAKDQEPSRDRRVSGSSRSRGRPGRRSRPQANAVTAQRPWGLIAAAIAVVVFATAVITYAVVQVNKAEAMRVDAVEEIEGVEVFDYAVGQKHVTGEVEYEQTPPVGGPHAGVWADCTGTVYEVDIRHENAMHSLEHGAVWITYDPEAVSEDDIALLAEVADKSGRMLSPYAGLDSPISIQSWNHQLKVDSAADPRIKQYADFMTFNAELSPEPGATCESPQFLADPLVEDSAALESDSGTSGQ
jgi:hypothetical protein